MRRRHSRSVSASDPRGFTLIEVLIALAIFAMAAVVLIGAYLNVLNSYSIAARERGADADVEFARMQLLKEPDPELAMEGGEFDGTEGRHIRWTSEIEPSATIPDLFTVHFTAEIIEATALTPETHEETFSLLRPTWSTDVTERTLLQQEVRNRIAEFQGVDPATLGVPAGGGGGGGRGGRGGGFAPGDGTGRGGRGGQGGRGGGFAPGGGGFQGGDAGFAPRGGAAGGQQPGAARGGGAAGGGAARGGGAAGRG
jgi:general secretion pathway protein I